MREPLRFAPILVVLAFALVGCHRDGAGVSAVKTLHNEAGAGLLSWDLTDTGIGGLKMRLPRGWKPVETPFGDTHFAAVAPRETTPGFAMVQVSVLSSGHATYDTAVAFARSTYRIVGGGGKPPEDREVVVGGRRAHIIGGTLEMGTATLHQRELCLVENGQVYTVTFTVASDIWPYVDAAVNASLQTITF